MLQVVQVDSIVDNTILIQLIISDFHFDSKKRISCRPGYFTHGITPAGIMRFFTTPRVVFDMRLLQRAYTVDSFADRISESCVHVVPVVSDWMIGAGLSNVGDQKMCSRHRMCCL